MRLDAASLAAWITAAIAIGTLLFVRRFGGGEALRQIELANHILEKRVHELEALVAVQAEELGTLRLATNVQATIQPVLEALTMHETNAGKRSEATLTLLAMMAKQLGADESDVDEAKAV